MIDSNQITLDLLGLSLEEISYHSEKGNYSIISEHLEGPIFRTIMIGTPYYQDALKHNAIGETILRRLKEKGYSGKAYFIVDSSKLKTVTSDARKLFLEFMAIDNFGGLMVHGMNFFTTAAIKITKVILPLKHYYLVSNEQKGLEKARELISQESKKKIQVFEEHLKILAKQNNLVIAEHLYFSSKDKLYFVNTWFIAPDIFLVVPNGYANIENTELFSKEFENFVALQLSPGVKYFRIQLYSFMTGADVKSRRFFVNWMKKNAPLMQLAVFVSSNSLMRTIIRFGLSLYPKSKKIRLANSLESAFEKIKQTREGGDLENNLNNHTLYELDYSEFSIPPNEEEKNSLIAQLIDENNLLKKKYKQHASQLFETIGRMSWDKGFELPKYEVFEEDPFFEVFNAVEMVFADLTQMFEDNNNNVKELNEHKENLEKIVEQRTRDLETARKKAVESDLLKSAFLANMSHEIRSPMNSIVGFSDLLSEPNLTEQQKADYIRLINSSSEVLMRLIEDIIDIAKIEAGQLKIRKTTIKLNRLMVKLEETFRAQNENLYKKPIELILKNDQNDDFIIVSDNIRLHQILFNLLNNAFKFTKDGSIEFGYKVYGAIIYFYIKDSGIGISQEQQGLVFERFRQISSPDQKTNTGTGLGLAISKSLVEMMGGKINLDSELHKGSVFSFTIPLEALSSSDISNSTPVSVKKADYKYRWENKKVLIAEDIDANFRYLSEVLAKTKIQIYRAINGLEAVELFKTLNPDIVLMDIQMPEMNGYEAFNKLRKIDNKTPIIAQTAYAMIEEKEKIIDYGFSAYLAKPISSKALIKTMGEFLQDD